MIKTCLDVIKHFDESDGQDGDIVTLRIKELGITLAEITE